MDTYEHTLCLKCGDQGFAHIVVGSGKGQYFGLSFCTHKCLAQWLEANATREDQALERFQRTTQEV